MKHSQGRVAARNKTGWSPTSSNVTQAAIHKGEMERTNNTQKKGIRVCDECHTSTILCCKRDMNE